MLTVKSISSMEEEPLPPVHGITSAADDVDTDFTATSIVNNEVGMHSVALDEAVHEGTDFAEQESVL